MKFLTFMISTLALSAAAVHADNTPASTDPTAITGATMMKKAKHRLGKKQTAHVEHSVKDAPKPTTEKEAPKEI